MNDKNKTWFKAIEDEIVWKSYDAETVERARRYINFALDRELRILNGNSSRLYIGGYCRGAAMALL